MGPGQYPANGRARSQQWRTDSEQHGSGQLRGLKVVEFAHVVAGPLAGSMLADQGADVVHVEPPGAGDAARAMGPRRDGVPLWFKVAGRNKRSVTLDLHHEAGRHVAHRLVAWADVVIVTLRAGRLRAWGLDWDSVHARQPPGRPAADLRLRRHLVAGGRPRLRQDG